MFESERKLTLLSDPDPNLLTADPFHRLIFLLLAVLKQWVVVVVGAPLSPSPLSRILIWFLQMDPGAGEEKNRFSIYMLIISVLLN